METHWVDDFVIFLIIGMEDKKQEPSAADEREVLIQTLDAVRKIFEYREWIMEGRGAYPYNDEKYREEVRYMYNEFDALMKNTWQNIKSKSNEYRNDVLIASMQAKIVRAVKFALSDSRSPNVIMYPVASGVIFHLQKYFNEESIKAEIFFTQSATGSDCSDLKYKADTELFVFDLIDKSSESFQLGIVGLITKELVGRKVLFTCHSTDGLIEELRQLVNFTLIV